MSDDEDTVESVPSDDGGDAGAEPDEDAMADTRADTAPDTAVEDGDAVEPSPGEEGSEQNIEEILNRAEELQAVVDRVADHDEDLADDLVSVAETADQFEETIRHQRAELIDLGERLEQQAETIANLQSELDETTQALEEADDRVEELEQAFKRKQADFENYKKRAKKRQEQVEALATEDLVSKLVGVRDNLKRAIDEDHQDVEGLRDGVEMTLREFDRILADEDVEEIDPETGSEVDPQRHSVMARVESEEPEGTIAEVFTPGYEMSEKVIQHAQVTVSTGEDDTEDETAEHESDEPEDDASPEEADSPDTTDEGVQDEERAEEPVRRSDDEAIAMGGDVEDEDESMDSPERDGEATDSDEDPIELGGDVRDEPE